MAVPTDLRGKPLKPLQTASRHRDFRPLLRQRPRSSLANATAGAGDQRNGSVKWGSGHQRSRPFSRLRVSATRELAGLLASRLAAASNEQFGARLVVVQAIAGANPSACLLEVL
jgi:hypothetical protein